MEACKDANSAHQQNDKVRSIKELVDMGLAQVPARYVRPPQERPRLMMLSSPPPSSRHHHHHHHHDASSQVPVVDLHQPNSRVVQEVGAASSQWGIFQVTNHGIASSLQNELWSAADYFFALPTNTKLQLVSQDSSSSLRFFSGFFPHEKVKEWKDTLGFKPTGSTNPKSDLPHFLGEPMLRFHKEIRVLAQKVCEAIFASLELDFKNFNTFLSRETMGFNYYPSCPEPELTFGLSSHSDFGSITILMQDQVEGLQVRRNNDWVIVKPIQNSFIVMLGDQLEILTNGHYKSVEHRVVTNQKKPRMSIACFYGPKEDEKVKPLDKFIGKNSPILYKEILFSDYLKLGFGKELHGKSNLENIRMKDIVSP